MSALDGAKSCLKKSLLETDECLNNLLVSVLFVKHSLADA